MTCDNTIEVATRDATAFPFVFDARQDHAGIGTITLGVESADDVEAREKLLDETMPLRHTKTCEKLREGREPAEDLSFVAKDNGLVVGTVRLWHVDAGAGRPALLLGPLAVASSHRSHGIGAKLMRLALARARENGHRAILLVGDAPYYNRFGFERRFAEGLALPGPVDNDRFLGLELEPGALADARGLVRPTGLRTRRIIKRSGLVLAQQAQAA